MTQWTSMTVKNNAFIAKASNGDMLYSYDGGLTWIGQLCDICHKSVINLQNHCTEIGDNEHVVLSVHIA